MFISMYLISRFKKIIVRLHDKYGRYICGARRNPGPSAAGTFDVSSATGRYKRRRRCHRTDTFTLTV